MHSVRLLLVLVLLGSCASTGGSGLPDPESERVRVTLLDFESGNEFALVNEGSVDKLEFYSEARSNANTKVATDEIVGAVVELLEIEGVWSRMVEGAAVPGAGATKAIEVVSGDRVRHVLRRGTDSTEDLLAFRNCQLGFLTIYQNVTSLQAIEGPVEFEGPATSRGRR